MVRSIPLTLGVRSGVLKPFSRSFSLPLVAITECSPLPTDQLLVGVRSPPPTVSVWPAFFSLSLFLSVTILAEFSLRNFDAIFDTQVSVFIEKGRPITAWADSCNRLEGKRHKLPNSHLFAHQPSNCSLWRVGCLEIGPMPQSASQVHPPRPTDPIKTHRPLVVQPPPSRTLDRPWTGNTGPDHNTPPS